MSHLRLVAIVAQWEFRRYFKWKDQLIGLAFFVVLSLVWAGAAAIAASKGRTMTVALAGVELSAPEGTRLHFVPAPESDSARAAALAADEVQGVLVRNPAGDFELLVTRDPRYRVELVELLDSLVRGERLAESGLAPADLERIMAPAALAVRFTEPGRASRGTGEKFAAMAFIVLMLMGTFSSMAYILTGITSEKQLRVTESVLAAIPPQAWIDGKIAGITLYSLASLVTLIGGSLILAAGAYFSSGFTLPSAAVRPAVLLVLLVFTVLGLLLWNAFYGALASTIDDPNTSSRGVLLMLPALPVVMSLAVVRDPDSVLSRVLALVPVTSAPAMPIRLVLSDPSLLEVAASVMLLAAAIWMMRRVAGRIFEIGMLMYGKEPSLREAIRWARSS